MRFVAAYSIDDEDEDSVLDAIDNIVGDSGDSSRFVAFSTIEGSSFIIVSTEEPVPDDGDAVPVPLVVALSEAERYGDDAVWFEPTSHHEGRRELDAIINDCVIDEALEAPLSTRSEAHYKPLSTLPPKKGSKRALAAIKGLDPSPAPPAPSPSPEPARAQEKASERSREESPAPARTRKARPMPKKAQSDSSEDMALVKARAKDRVKQDEADIDRLMDEWTM